MLRDLAIDSLPSHTETPDEKDAQSSPPPLPLSASAEKASTVPLSQTKQSAEDTEDSTRALHHDVHDSATPPSSSPLSLSEPWEEGLIAPNDMAANLAQLIEASEGNDTANPATCTANSDTSAEAAASPSTPLVSSTMTCAAATTSKAANDVNATTAAEVLPTSSADSVTAANRRSLVGQKLPSTTPGTSTNAVAALTPRRAAKQALDERARIKQSLLQPSRVLPSRARSTGRLLMGPRSLQPPVASSSSANTGASGAGATSGLPPARAAAIAANGFILPTPPSLRRSSSCSPERGGGRRLSPRAAAAARALGLPVHGTAVPSGRPINRKRAASTGRALSGKKLLAEEVARLAVKKGEPEQPQEEVQYNQERPQQHQEQSQLEKQQQPAPADLEMRISSSSTQESNTEERSSNSTTTTNASASVAAVDNLAADSHAMQHNLTDENPHSAADATQKTAKELKAAAAADTKRLMDAARVAREKKEAAKAEKQRLEVQRLKEAIAAAHAQEKVQNAQEVAANQEAACGEAPSSKTAATDGGGAAPSEGTATENNLSPPHEDASLSHSLDDFDL